MGVNNEPYGDREMSKGRATPEQGLLFVNHRGEWWEAPAEAPQAVVPPKDYERRDILGALVKSIRALKTVLQQDVTQLRETGTFTEIQPKVMAVYDEHVINMLALTGLIHTISAERGGLRVAIPAPEGYAIEHARYCEYDVGEHQLVGMPGVIVFTAEQILSD